LHSRVRPPESLAACDAGPAVGAATGAQHVGCPDWPAALGARMLAGVAAPAITRRAEERRSAGGTGSLRGLAFAARLHVATKSVTAVLAGPLPAGAKAATVLPPLVGHPATSARPRGHPAVQALPEHASEDRNHTTHIRAPLPGKLGMRPPGAGTYCRSRRRFAPSSGRCCNNGHSQGTPGYKTRTGARC
jgi:hypothetical protein